MTETTPLTDREKELLLHEEFVTEVLKRRPSPSRARPTLQAVLDSGVLKVLITVLGTGIFSTWFASELQRGATEREFQNQIIQIYSEHKAGEVRAYWERRHETATSSLKLLGTVLRDAEDLLESKSFVRPRDPAKAQVIKQQTQDIRRQFNLTTGKLDSERAATAMSVSLNIGSEAGDAWGGAASKVDAFIQCAESFRPGPDATNPCDSERKTAVDAVTKTTISFSSTPSPDWITSREVSQIRGALNDAGNS